MLAIAMLGGCSAAGGPPPYLAPRAAENIDPRLLVVTPEAPATPVSPALASRLAGLVAQARNGEPAFDVAADRAEALAGSAGAAQSEGWIAAQQAVSVAVAARAPIARALGEIDSTMAEAIAAKGTLSAADFDAIRAAAALVAEIDNRQSRRIDAVQRRLGS